MLTNNPFAELSLVLPAVSMQVFVVLMVLLIIIGTIFGQFRYFWEIEKKILIRAG